MTRQLSARAVGERHRNRRVAIRWRGTSSPGPIEYDGGRQVTAYVPPAPPDAVVFAGDGQLISQWGQPPRVDRRTVHDDRRRTPGLPTRRCGSMSTRQSFDPERFAAHETFFVEDVRRWARTRLGVARPRRAHCGIRCLGGWRAGARHRPPASRCRWPRSSARSPGGGYRPPAVMPNSIPRSYLVAGTLEPFFLKNATRWATALKNAGGDVVMTRAGWGARRRFLVERSSR